MTGGIGIGIIGAGEFGLFALRQFLRTPGATLAGVAGSSRQTARDTAREFGLEGVVGVEDLLADENVDLVYIATPPFLHYRQAMAALAAGKHVLCEKPLAMTVAEAEDIAACARRRDRLLVANLMQRYNPLYDAVGTLVDSGVLGKVLHGSFENLASDEGLAADHWFWDPVRSGGIFIEHGVHFFDVFAGWLGAGSVESARIGVRDGSGIEDQVGCVMRYPGGAWVDFYHGFHQADRMDRQQWRLVFEQGDLTLTDWIPGRLRLHALVDDDRLGRIVQALPGCHVDVADRRSPGEPARARGRTLDACRVVEISAGDGQDADDRYARVLRAMFADQVAWIRDRGHRRRVTEANAVDSLAAACAADRLARTGRQAQDTQVQGGRVQGGQVRGGQAEGGARTPRHPVSPPAAAQTVSTSEA